MNDMLAQQYGINATQENAAQIATMLGKVMNGQTGALSRYGYTFDEAQEKILKYGTEAQRAATLCDVVSASTANAATIFFPTSQRTLGFLLFFLVHMIKELESQVQKREKEKMRPRRGYNLFPFEFD